MRWLYLLLLISVIGWDLTSPKPVHAQTGCTQNATDTSTASGSRKLATAGVRQVQICAVYFAINQPATPANFKLVAGTGTNCGTNTVDVTLTWIGVASSFQQMGQEPQNVTWTAPAGYDVCWSLSQAVTAGSVQILFNLN